MPYIPTTEEEKQRMLETMGFKTFDDLIEAIPEKLRLKEPLDLPEPLSELEIMRLVRELIRRTLSAQVANSFLGAGVYDHFIPAAIDTIISRPEFMTAYTPYQAEVSQGTLQAIFEFQTMICELTGMEIANASMYDGATAAAEAVLMSVRKNHKQKAVLSGTLHPEFLKVIKCYTEGIGLELITVPAKEGRIDAEAFASAIDANTSCAVIQTPNFYGNLEEMFELEKIVHQQENCFLIAAVDPISLAIFNAPSEYRADIVVGEGQALGNPMNMGGPLFGFFASRLDLARSMPGRIVGATVDVEGKKAYVLTLQAREQHIRREKATSNICSNEALCALAATVYLSLLGKEGLREVALQSFRKAHYLASEICKLNGFSLAYPRAPFFKEFVISTPLPATEIIDKLLKRNIFPGLDLAAYGEPNQLMLAVTEKKLRADLDELVQALKEAANV
ncbi:MAG TPA: aminomethyl-transferring glycine dehydrogenase subunit GcvPA [Candidatus Cloacimonadota bacterium]|nr:aminomethyl-transferring glycine dehydrogenase subunit GcvPA [Candidatus Cloacimonadota bacterium]